MREVGPFLKSTHIYAQFFFFKHQRGRLWAAWSCADTDDDVFQCSLCPRMQVEKNEEEAQISVFLSAPQMDWWIDH